MRLIPPSAASAIVITVSQEYGIALEVKQPTDGKRNSPATPLMAHSDGPR